MIIQILTMGLIAAIVIPPTFAMVFPWATIRFMEGIRFYRKGSLDYEIEEYLTESGNQQRHARYTYKNKENYVRTETFRLILWMFLIFLPVFLGLSIVGYYFVS